MSDLSLFEATKPRPVSFYSYINNHIGNSKQLLKIGDWVSIVGEVGKNGNKIPGKGYSPIFGYRVNKILDDGFFIATNIDGKEINTTIYDIVLTYSNEPKEYYPQSN